MHTDDYGIPTTFDFVNEYLSNKNCVHEIDILNIDMSSLVYSLPSYNLFSNNVGITDILDQIIYNLLITNIVEKDLSNTSIKILYTRVIDQLLTYDEGDISINYDKFSNYYVNLYNTVTSAIGNYTSGYTKLNKLPIFDNIVDLDRFYTISDVSINTSYSNFMLRINIALFRRNKDEVSRKRNRSFNIKT